ncbi:HET-domain-containing protein [Hypoxylon trugodes]|uniref:HET-domain-containing protein n=1 Tax=Hypoxylon trugodes TaxID=326681 RepID=UPI002198E0FC|nr:HET-domain-containing protein [Hypoxylon trugodes]KAI1391136.1 HET-domain-containing protein [Hypoxylon trugodes]
MSDPLYSYKKCCPLSDPSKELRILEIHDNRQDLIECELKRFKLDDVGKYAALSWRWGEKGGMNMIRILHSSGFHTFSIPNNLKPAIEELRNSGVLRVWIDFICMNQDNTDEKNYQVPMMSSIYGRAQCVFVWLGEEGDNSTLAIQFMKNRVLNLGEFDSLIRDNATVKEWKALSTLMNRSWFSRRWIVQEIAIAKEAILLCGAERIGWKDFADAISLFNEVETGSREVSKVMKSNKDLGHMPDFFGNVSELSATKLVEETNNLFRRLSGGERQAQFSLEYLVSKLIAFDSTEPRDTIYALLAIARDTVPVTMNLGKDVIQEWSWKDDIKKKLIEVLETKIVSKPYPVDYQLPLSEVYVQFVKWAITKSDKSRALDIICRPWAPVPELPDGLDYEDEERDTHWRVKTGSKRPREEGEDTLPSWTPTLARAAFGMDGTGRRMTRKNADSLVALPPQHVYSAAGTRRLTKNFRIEDGVTKYSVNEELNGLHYHSLFVEGFILDEVKELKSSSQQGNIPNDWIVMAKRIAREYAQRMPPEDAERMDLDTGLLDEFWRTLVADRSPTGENARRYYSRLLRHALRQGVQGDVLNTKDILNWGNCSVVGEVLRRVQSVIWNRKLMRTKDGQRLGLAPQYSRKGDLICILYGCSVPVILRELTKSSDEVAEETRRREEKQREIDKKVAQRFFHLWRINLARRKCSSTAQATGLSLQQENRNHETETNGNTAKTPGRVNSVPVMTKREPRVRLESEPQTFYQLIGECYVDGMMNGEALSSSSASMLFEIR